MKTFVLSVFLCTALGSTAQQTYESGGLENGSALPINISGQLANTVKFSRLVEGSPFFLDDYTPGTITSTLGVKFKNQLIKLNLVDRLVYYRDAKGADMVPGIDLAAITLETGPGGETTSFDFFADNKLDNAQPWGWFQRLGAGNNFGFYKQIIKIINAQKPYGSATTEERITSKTNYLVWTGKNFVAPKKLDDIAPLFPGKTQAILDFIKINSLKAKQDKDWGRLAEFIQAN